MKTFLIEYDANRQNSASIPQSDSIQNIVLSAGVMKSVTVPTGANVVLFGANGNFFCKFDAAVVVPAVDITDGSGGEINPSIRSIPGVTTINIISASNIIVTLSFYVVPKTAI